MNGKSDENEYLMMSGIQHFVFCKRQWALIHIEQQWQENHLTTEGKIQHERCHSDITEQRNQILTVRGMRVVSHELKLSGICDVVEFYQNEHGVPLVGREGKWIPHPVEYKHGKSKPDLSDRIQLCSQAMALEEMLVCDISEAAVFYQEVRRRETVLIDSELRKETKSIAEEMEGYYQKRYTPKVRKTRKCNSCSLKEICLPQLTQSKHPRSYIDSYLKEYEK